jgi:hypothetical protein
VDKGLVVAAWASATAPKGLPPVSAITVFSQTLSFQKRGLPTFDRAKVEITTGNDNAGSGMELIGSLSGQKKAFCLKPSTDLSSDGTCSNGDGVKDQNGKDTWDNFTSSTQTFPLDTPQTSTAGFSTITLRSRQSSCGTSCDNWDLQGIKVTVLDSSGTLPPKVLLDIFNPRDHNKNDNCMARFKGPQETHTVTYALNAASPTAAQQVTFFGNTPPGSCPQSE